MACGVQAGRPRVAARLPNLGVSIVVWLVLLATVAVALLRHRGPNT
jgi:hypothetical protein